MSGLKLIIPTTFTDTTLPILRSDSVMSVGSLALIEPNHPANVFSGVPSNGALVPNIAHAEAAAMLALSDTGFPSVWGQAGTVSGAKGKVERTTKGGIHTIISQAPGIAIGDGCKLDLASQIRSYMYANKGHSFYISAWNRMTRAAGSSGGSAGVNLEFGSGGNSSIYAFYRGSNGWSENGGASVNVRQGTPNVVGNNFTSYATQANLTNLTAAPLNAGPSWGMFSGTFNAAVSGWATLLPSWVFYRLYVEDLNVSGRTWAAVDALDNAEYTKQVLTAGGRYYGDTFTDPTTIP